MATVALSVENPNIHDVMSATDPKGAIAKVVQALAKKCPLLDDMTMMEGNLPTGHEFVTQTGLPSIGVRGFNEGVPASKDQNDKITETCGMIEGRSVVDVKLAGINGNAAAYVAGRALAFTTSFKNEIETGMFYYSTKTSPKRWMGLSPRLDSLSGPYNDQIVNCQISSSGSDQASMWFVVWSPETVYAIYPKGSQGGLQMHDMGIQMVTDGAGNRYRAFERVWNWDIGLCVNDARYLVRLANIDTSAIVGTGKLLIEDMIRAYHKLQDTVSGRLAIYCNRTIATYLHLQAQDSTKNSTLAIENIGGRPVTTFLGAPIRITDSLLDTEDVVA